MKKELRQIASLFGTEIRNLASILSLMRRRRRSVAIIGLFTVALLAIKGIAEAHPSLSYLPFLRGGGYAAAAAKSSTMMKPPQKKTRSRIARPRRRGGPVLFGLVVDLHRTADAFGSKVVAETGKQWNGLHENVGREWGKLASSVENLFSKERRRDGGALDEVLRTFRTVLDGSDVDTARLLKACRAHLVLMKSGGAALKLVAKDMEANLNKAESLFDGLPKGEGRTLASLLEEERQSGIHDGSELKDASAAMGLLWIRRSLAFQLDLYASLIPSDGRHPKDAAADAYLKTLAPYHGWLLSKAFPLSLSQMPDRRAFIAKFGGREADDLDEDDEREIVRKLRALVAVWKPIIGTWKYEFERLDLEDTRLV